MLWTPSDREDLCSTEGASVANPCRSGSTEATGGLRLGALLYPVPHDDPTADVPALSVFDDDCIGLGTFGRPSSGRLEEGCDAVGLCDM